MKQTLLRMLLIFDAAILLLLGGAFMLLPARMLDLFGFHGIPPGIHFIVGIFGTVYATLGIGYVFAVQNPLRNVVWIQVAIARGVLEALFSLICVGQGIVTFRHAGFSAVVPALLAIGYALLYPRPQPPPQTEAPPTT